MTKNQHFVPQFYLRRFLNPRNLVEVLDLNLMKCANPRGTKKICCAEFFYGIETGIRDETSQKIEDWFQKMENFIADNLDSIVDKILNNKQIEMADIFILATESNDAPDKPRIRFKRKTLLKRDEGEVLELNAVMANQAHQYIYAKNKQDLEDLLNERKRQEEFFATPKGKIVKAQLDAERQN
jgi:Protein of unknown function (DUF4238)